MHLVQILLPLKTNTGKPLPENLFSKIKQELTEHFYGLTAYTRAPAEGLWRPRKGTKRDEIVVYEVMARSFDRRWWKQYRKRLEGLFRQESIVIRAERIMLL